MSKRQYSPGAVQVEVPLSARLDVCIEYIAAENDIKPLAPHPKRSDDGLNYSRIAEIAVAEWGKVIESGAVLSRATLLRYIVEYVNATEFEPIKRSRKVYVQSDTRATLDAIVEHLSDTFGYVPYLHIGRRFKSANLRLVITLALVRYADKPGVDLPEMGA